jgi:hypothetical protein
LADQALAQSYSVNLVVRLRCCDFRSSLVVRSRTAEFLERMA